MDKLKRKRVGNYHHHGNPKHGLFHDNQTEIIQSLTNNEKSLREPKSRKI